MPAAADHDFRACPIIGCKENQGVFEGLHSFQLFDHPADFPVHDVDHRSVNGHLGRLESLLLCGQLFPGNRSVDLPRAKFPNGIGEGIGRAKARFEF